MSLQIDRDTLMRYLLGGMAIGGGTATATSAAHYFNSLRNRKKREKDTSYNDDTLVVKVPGPNKVAGILDSSGRYAGTGKTLAASILAGVGGMGLSYNLARRYYIDRQLKEKQRQIDEAQKIYVGDLMAPSPQRKNASSRSQFGTLSSVSGGAGALMLLSVLAAGATTNKILSHYFPGYTRSQVSRPKRVVIKRDTRPTESTKGKPGGGMEKQAPTETRDINTVTESELENMLSIKSASYDPDSDICGLIDYIADGKLEDFKKDLRQRGLSDSLDKVAGYRMKKANTFYRDIAIRALVSDPVVSEAILPVAASEFYEMAPSYCKTASTPEMQPYHEDLIGISICMGDTSRRLKWAHVGDAFIRAAERSGMSKEAAAAPARLIAEKALPQKVLMGALLADYLARKGSERNEEPGADAPPIGDNLTGASSQTSNPEIDTIDSDAERFVEENPDLQEVFKSHAGT